MGSLCDILCCCLLFLLLLFLFFLWGGGGGGGGGGSSLQSCTSLDVDPSMGKECLVMHYKQVDVTRMLATPTTRNHFLLITDVVVWQCRLRLCSFLVTFDMTSRFLTPPCTCHGNLSI